MGIGSNLKRLRKKQGLSQRMLAVNSSISQAFISGIEAGQKQPTIPIVKKLAAALGVTVSELLDEDVRPTGTEGRR